MNLSKLLYNLLIFSSLLSINEALAQEIFDSNHLKNSVIAHRGMPRHAPEETAPSYWLAKKLGADYLEADLQRTKDSVIICLHDANLKRTTNIDQVFPGRTNQPVSNFTLEELKQLDAGSWFNKKYKDEARDSFKGEKILTLDELIDIAEKGDQITGLYLETKQPDLFPGIEKQLFELLDERGWINNPDKRLILQTFSTKSLQLLNMYFPETPKCMLIWNGDEFLKDGVTPEKLKQAINFAKNHGAKIIGPSFNGDKNDYYNLMQGWMVAMYHQMGMTIHLYTFDTNEDNIKYVPLSDGQFTNRTDLVLDYYNRPHKSPKELMYQLGYK